MNLDTSYLFRHISMYLNMISAGRRSNYLDEEDPAQDDSRSPARVRLARADARVSSARHPKLLDLLPKISLY